MVLLLDSLLENRNKWGGIIEIGWLKQFDIFDKNYKVCKILILIFNTLF